MGFLKQKSVGLHVVSLPQHSEQSQRLEIRHVEGLVVEVVVQNEHQQPPNHSAQPLRQPVEIVESLQCTWCHGSFAQNKKKTRGHVLAPNLRGLQKFLAGVFIL